MFLGGGENRLRTKNGGKLKKIPEKIFTKKVTLTKLKNMKQKKLRVGDKIRWNLPIGSSTVYTILAIDTSRPKEQVGEHQFPQEVLFQWQAGGSLIQRWGHSYQLLYKSLNETKITRLQSTLEPYKEIPTFSF